MALDKNKRYAIKTHDKRTKNACVCLITKMETKIKTKKFKFLRISEILEREDMITPIKTMTINQIMERKDDLLVSVDDIKQMAKNERHKAIDYFANYVKVEILPMLQTEEEHDIAMKTVDAIVGELKLLNLILASRTELY